MNANALRASTPGQRLAERLATDGIRDARVLKAIAEVPRQYFVDEALASRAYDDTPLPIGNRQTISQPYVVARMTEALIEHRLPDRVLEIGTGSGYQAAVLARIVAQVYTVERIAELLNQTRPRLNALGLMNIHTRHGDGCSGWRSQAPFDAIIVTAAASSLTAELFAQLSDDGVLVAPVGDPDGVQQLLRYRKHQLQSPELLGAVRFVPLLAGLA